MQKKNVIKIQYTFKDKNCKQPINKRNSSTSQKTPTETLTAKIIFNGKLQHDHEKGKNFHFNTLSL